MSSTEGTVMFSQALHPAVFALLLGGVAAITMFSLHPVIAALSLVGALACSLLTRGVSLTSAGLRWQLPAVVLIALANPLFTASGSTLLLHVGPVAVYVESLAFGATAALVMVSSILWLECLAHVVPPDVVRATLGRSLPTVALSVSMTFALVPQLLRRHDAVREAIAANTASRAPAPQDPLVAAAARSGTLLDWALEDSLVRADAMRARGWAALPRRTSYRSFQLRGRDVIALASCASVLAVAAPLVWVACVQWRFYPVMPRLVVWWGYAPFALACVLPSLCLAFVRLRWLLLDRWPCRAVGKTQGRSMVFQVAQTLVVGGVGL